VAAMSLAVAGVAAMLLAGAGRIRRAPTT